MKTTPGFVISPQGRHTPSSFGHDLGLKEAARVINAATKKTKGTSLHDAFESTNGMLSTATSILTGLRFANGVRAALANNGNNSVSNNDKSQVPLLTHTIGNPIGKNDTQYFKTETHIGKPSTERILKLQSGPFIECVTKTLSDSLKDYQSHTKRQHLTLTGGFNEKNFTFFAEDHSLSVSDFYTLFNVERFYKTDFQKDDGVTDIFGCIKKTTNIIKFKNRLPYFSVHINLHLLKIHDLETDIRSLIKDITHNTYNTKIDNAGKIPAKLQFSNPELYPITNESSISFLTDLSCNLTLSTKFKEQAQIIESWSTTLGPGSSWEFKLHQHFGRGINLNYISDLHHRQPEQNITENVVSTVTQAATNATNTTSNATKKNKKKTIEKLIKRKKKYQNDHPVSYILFAEFVGDRRASIIRLSDKDIFSGYSPFKIGVEFSHEITYLTNQESTNDLLVYKKPRLGKDFTEDENEYANIFCPDRETNLHIDFKNINFSNTNNKKATFAMEYDQVIAGTSDTPNILQSLKETFTTLGLDPSTITENDSKLNFNKSEYQGPATAPPPENNENNEDESDAKSSDGNLRKN